MNFESILTTTKQLDPGTSLVLSYHGSVHELILTEMLNHFYKSDHDTSPSSSLMINGDGNADDKPLRTDVFVLVCLHRCHLFYKRFLRTVPVNQRKSIQFVDLTRLVQQRMTVWFGSGDQSFSGLNFCQELITEIRKQIDTIVNQPNQFYSVFIDNLTGLFDLGCSARDIYRFVNELCKKPSILSCCDGVEPSQVVVIGFNLANLYSEPYSSDADQALIHLIEMCKLRSSLIIEVKPLSTGYTHTLDGQITVTFRQNPFEYCKQSAQSVFHYKVQSKTILFYTPGTCKLLT